MFKFIVPANVVETLIVAGARAAGFMADGTINIRCPLFLLLLLVGVSGISSYGVIRRTELKK